MKLTISLLSFLFLQLNPIVLLSAKRLKLLQNQCRPLISDGVNWPIRAPKTPEQSGIDCKKMFNRLVGQTLYLYDVRNLSISPALNSNFFKYPEPVDCLDSDNNVINCPNLDIEQITFTKNTPTTLLATVLHPDMVSNTAIVRLLNNDKLCQISIQPQESKKFKTEIYNVLALYDGRQNQYDNPKCDEEALALSPTFQDDETKTLCKQKVEESLQEALKRIDKRDHEELKRRAKELKKDCDKAVLNQLEVNFILDPEVDSSW